MVHGTHAKGIKAFHVVNDQLCALDINIRESKFRFIFIYLPDCSYDDAVLEDTYAQLDFLCGRGNQLNRRIIIAGDWNAVVGMQRETEENTVGPYGSGRRNSRGKWMVNWASSQNLVIANTCFNGDFEQQWTYVNGGIKRQLDCIVVDQWVMRRAMEARASDDIGIGLDHCTETATLELETNTTTTPKRAKRPRRQSNRDWKPKSVDICQEQIRD